MPKPKELYLYTSINDWSVKDLLVALEDSMGDEVRMRENCGGGSVMACYGLCAKIYEHGDVTILVDGMAASGGANLLPYAKKVECLDVSTFLLHRADMYVSTEEDKAFLAKVNADLRAKLELRVDAAKFKKVTGYTLDQMFDTEKRIDIMLDADQAKKIGLVQKVNKLIPADITALNHRLMGIAAEHKPEPEEEPEKPTQMTKEELQKNHPAVYAEIFGLGVAAEKDRVESCLVFAEVDLAGVKAAIEGGKPLSAKQTSEFALKVMSSSTLKKIEAEAGEDTPTGDDTPTVQTEKEKADAAFDAAVNQNLGLKSKV